MSPSRLETDLQRPHPGVRSCVLRPSPLLEYAGNLPEIWMNIIAQADPRALFSLVQVNKAWFREGIGRLWHSPPANALRFRLMPNKGFNGPNRVDFYAGLVHHLDYTPQTDTENQSKGYTRVMKSKAIPELPNLRSVEVLSWSLRDRSVEQLQRIFRPSLRHVVLDDYVEQGYHGQRTRRSHGPAWFDVLIESCSLLESISLGEGLGISLEQLHHCICRMIHLKSIALERGNEHLITHHVASTLKSVKIGPEWMMEADAWNTLSQMHVLENLDVAAADYKITSDKILQLEGLEHLEHLHIWPANGLGATRCELMAVRLIMFIQAMPKLRDLRLWLEFDFFCHEEEVKATHNLHGRHPQFDDFGSREGYLEYVRKIAEVESAGAYDLATMCGSLNG